jgi:Glycosyl hydrolases family 2, sugar binding domain
MGTDQDNHAAVPPYAGRHPAEDHLAGDHPASQPADRHGPSRRQVLRGAGAGLGAAALAPVLAAGGRPADAATRTRLAARAAANRITDFGQGWKFALVNPDGITDPTGAYANAMDPGFDDSGWQQLDVPHDWSIELAPVDNASTSSATGFLPGGLAWYRKHFTLPKSLAGQRISIEFNGVYRNSDVYLNGKRRDGRRELLRIAHHDPGGRARRRLQHRVVELLRQGRDGQPARGERLQRQRLGVGVLAVPAVLRLGPGLVHDRRGARAARRDHRVLLGRVEVRPGAEPDDQPRHGV